MNGYKVKVYLETVFKLDGLEFEFDDSLKLVFSSPDGDVIVKKHTREVYDQRGYIGIIDSIYNME
jgi:hypothetical protein